MFFYRGKKITSGMASDEILVDEAAWLFPMSQGQNLNHIRILFLVGGKILVKLDHFPR